MHCGGRRLKYLKTLCKLRQISRIALYLLHTIGYRDIGVDTHLAGLHLHTVGRVHGFHSHCFAADGRVVLLPAASARTCAFARAALTAACNAS